MIRGARDRTSHHHHRRFSSDRQVPPNCIGLGLMVESLSGCALGGVWCTENLHCRLAILLLLDELKNLTSFRSRI